MGLIMRYKENGVMLASIIGITLLVIGIISGHGLMQEDVLGWMFNWDKDTVSIAIPLYGFIASVLPVWLLLVPRDYLSTYLKIGTILMLALGIIFVQPDIMMHMFTPFDQGGGPARLSTVRFCRLFSLPLPAAQSPVSMQLSAPERHRK